MSVVPDSHAVAIELNDVDVTEFCPYEKMEQEDRVADVSSFRFLMQNPDVIPVKHDAVFVYNPNTIEEDCVFSGYVASVKEIWRGIVTDYLVDCADKKLHLQKSIVAPNLYTGIDTDIIDDLATDVYPDLSNVYDFSTATSVGDIEFNLPANDDSLLDLLKQLADKSGASMRFERPGKGFHVAFDESDNLERDQTGLAGRSWRSEVFDGDGSIITTEAIVIGDGVDGTNAFKFAGTHFDADDLVALLFNIPKGLFFNLTFDLKFDLNGRDLNVVAPALTYGFLLDSSLENQWISIDVAAELDPTDIADVDPRAGTAAIFFHPTTTFTDSFNIWIDNIRIELKGSSVKDELVWDSSPDDADWDLDVQLSDEYANDISFDIGDFDDFNAVIIKGGKTSYAISEIFSSDGVSRFLQAPAPITGYTINVNTGTDLVPVWTAQDVGLWGTDSLTVDGGSMDVLYDLNTLFLFFNTAPPNLVNSVQLIATIQKPFRLLLEDAASADEPLFATIVEDETIASYEEAIGKGASELDKRNAARRLEIFTHNPGLKPGQNFHIVDSLRGVDETIRINQIDTEWLGGSGHAKFHLTFGEDEQAGLDGIVVETDKRSRKRSDLLTAETVTFDILVDEDGVPFVDDDDIAFEDD